ncbi:MAG TPA: hypothetical protein VHB73_07900 [Alphaproteobacteria bacterium]|nr:hypothetical protein [Alphaproteobacteria bacterium]
MKRLLLASGLTLLLAGCTAGYYTGTAYYDGPPPYEKDGYRYYYNSGYGGYVPAEPLYEQRTDDGWTVTPLPSPQPARCGYWGGGYSCWDPSVF